MPNSMSRQQERDLHIQISTLKSELELSTFLNKGVLQTNSEYKLRIVELERENAVLRVAESRLARTEDRLEAAEQRAEKEGRERTRLEEEREEWRKQRDLSGWQAKSWRGALERANSKLEGIGRLSVPEEVKEGPATAKHGSSSTSLKRSGRVASPSTSPLQTLSTTKKRRRVEESPTAADEEDEKTPPPSPDPKRRHSPKLTRIPQPPGKTKPRTSASAKKRDRPVADDTEFIIKIEDISPLRPHPAGEESDDDPLAMI